jgi:MFS family permease
MQTIANRSPVAHTAPRRGYPWELLILLWLAFFLHQADRQIFNNLLPLIRSDLQLSDVQLGLVASVFTATYGVCVMLGGYAGDVLHRKWIVVLSLVIWSAATLLTGLSTGVLLLIVLRGVATGGGEAFYFPSATSLISQFHRASRATALAIHQSALYFGIVASFVAGYVGERWGWRNAFFVFGGFGILLGGVLLRRLQDTPHEAAGATGASEPRPPLGEVLRALARKPTALLLCAALAGHVFVNIRTLDLRSALKSRTIAWFRAF